ncbi:MAG: hypothetical protein ABJD97_15850 [Betaproteobacteria bacterium]
MRVIAVALAVVLALCAALLARSHHRHANDPLSTAAPTTAAAAPGSAATATATATATPTAPLAAAAAAVVDTGPEPDEASLRRLELERIAALEKAGGMPVALTQTGARTTLHPKVWSVHKDECHKAMPPDGTWDCSLTITVTLMAGDDHPLPQGERISVRRGPTGEWILA